MPSFLKQRTKARTLAMQALYQNSIAPAHIEKIQLQFLTDNDQSSFDSEYFQFLVTQAFEHQSELQQKIEQCLPENNNLQSIDRVTCAVLYIAAIELQKSLDVPYRVAIDQGITLAKKYGPEGSYKLVNGVLDKLARHLRPNEIEDGI